MRPSTRVLQSLCVGCLQSFVPLVNGEEIGKHQNWMLKKIAHAL